MAVITEKAIPEIKFCKKCKKNIGPEDVFCRFCGAKQTADSRKPLKRANGTGCVSKLSGRRNKPWIVRLSKIEQGIVVQKSLGCFETKTAALVALENYNNHGLPQLHDAKVSEVHELWKAQHYPTLTEKGAEGYNASWKYLDSIASSKMADMKTAHFQKIVDNAIKEGKSRSVCEKIKQICGQLCKYAMSNDIINKNYAEMIKLPKYEKPERSAFTTEEILKIYTATSGSSAAEVIYVLIYTGLRIGELFSIEKKNVFPEEQYMTGGLKTAAGRNRVIPLHRNIIPIVVSWLHAGKGRYLLSDVEGIQHVDANFRDRNYYPLLEELGIRKLNPHCCRHTCATLMERAGVSHEEIKAILGHEKYETVSDNYIHTDKAQTIAAINKLL